MLHEQPYAKSLSYKNVAIVGEFRPKKRKDCWTCLAKETIQTRLCYSAERFLLYVL